MKTGRRLWAIAALLTGAGPRSAIAASLRRADTSGAAAIGSAEGAISSLARNRLHPELVSTLLREVEDAWVDGRVAVLRGDVKDAIARAEAMASCRKVAGSIVAGAEGDFDKAKTYMVEVCNRFGGLKGNHTMCQRFGQGIVGAMVGDPSYNRDELDLSVPCGSFYDSAVLPSALAFKEAQEKEVQTRQEPAQKEATLVTELENKDAAQSVEKRAEDVLRQANTSLHNAEEKELPNAIQNASNPAGNGTHASTATKMSPTRARLEETIRKTKAAIERHEKQKLAHSLAGTNATRSQISRNSSNATTSNSSNSK